VAANGAAAGGAYLNGAQSNSAQSNSSAGKGVPPGSTGAGQHHAPGGSGRAERTSGSGLGLSIVQAIANAHGGRATLESRLGQGTKVRVWLPVRIVP